jgi:hypothetical protein
MESTITQRQDDDVGANEMQANLDKQTPAPRVEGMRFETNVGIARSKRETRKPRWLNYYMIMDDHGCCGKR